MSQSSKTNHKIISLLIISALTIILSLLFFGQKGQLADQTVINCFKKENSKTHYNCQSFGLQVNSSYSYLTNQLDLRLYTVKQLPFKAYTYIKDNSKKTCTTEDFNNKDNKVYSGNYLLDNVLKDYDINKLTTKHKDNLYVCFKHTKDNKTNYLLNYKLDLTRLKPTSQYHNNCQKDNYMFKDLVCTEFKTNINDTYDKAKKTLTLTLKDSPTTPSDKDKDKDSKDKANLSQTTYNAYLVNTSPKKYTCSSTDFKQSLNTAPLKLKTTSNSKQPYTVTISNLNESTLNALRKDPKKKLAICFKTPSLNNQTHYYSLFTIDVDYFKKPALTRFSLVKPTTTTKDKDTSKPKEDKPVEQSSSTTTTTIPQTNSVSNSQPSTDNLASRVEKLEEDTPRYLVEIANAMRLTDKGKEVFYSTKIDIRSNEKVPCVCYSTAGIIYVPGAPDGYEYMVIRDLMHEFLHAVYFQRLVGSNQFDEITEELRQFYVKSDWLQYKIQNYINKGSIPANYKPNNTVFLTELHSIAAADIDYESLSIMPKSLDSYYDQYFEDWQDLRRKTQKGYNEDFEHLVFP